MGTEPDTRPTRIATALPSARARRVRMAGAMLAGMLLLLAFASASGAGAATLNVTTTADSSDGECTPSLCSLRDAVEAADAAGEAETVEVPAGEYALTLGPLALSSSHLASISGAGARSTVVETEGDFRVLELTAMAAAKVSGVTLSGGDPEDEMLPGEYERLSGGTVLSEGDLTLEESRVTGGTAMNAGGLYSDGVLTVIRSLIDGNRSTYQGGGAEVFGQARFIDSTIADNEINSELALFPVFRGGGEVGGGLVNYGALTLAGTTIADNSLAVGPAAEGSGVALAAGAASAADSIVAGNAGEASQCKGALIAATAPNLDSDGSCFDGEGELHGDALLGPLAGNGGPTDTLALEAASPALAAGRECDALDQRGVARPTSGCDLGAYELTPAPPPPVTTGSATTTLTTTGARLAPPSNHFYFTVRHHRADGIAVRVKVPGTGDVSAIATEEDPGLKARIALVPGHNRFRYASASGIAERAGSIVLVLEPTSAGRAIIARHHHHRWALNVRVVVTFTPNGGYPRTRVEPLRIFLAG